MLRKLVAALFVAIWVLVLGIDFLGDAGFIHSYSTADTDKSVDAVLRSLGETVKISKDSEIATGHRSSAQSWVFYPDLVQGVSSNRFAEEINFARADIPVHKLNRVFLI